MVIRLAGKCRYLGIYMPPVRATAPTRSPPCPPWGTGRTGVARPRNSTSPMLNSISPMRKAPNAFGDRAVHPLHARQPMEDQKSPPFHNRGGMPPPHHTRMDG